MTFSEPKPIPPILERLKAPREDGEILSRPALHQGVDVARKNAALLNQSTIMVAGRSLPEFRNWARAESLLAAQLWMSRNLQIEMPAASDALLFITGHQPQLNHPGVWMKNVAAARLAECCGGIGLNLIVDNDLAGPASVRCPAGTRTGPRFEELFFDAIHATQPWEELSLQDEDLFRSFGSRVQELMSKWGITPVLNQVWPTAVDSIKKTRQLASILTACRVAQERQWHIRNLELPVSEMCQTEPFLAFVAHLCLNFETLFSTYNQAVHDYRRKYRIRNHRHPVPDLERVEDQYELPFWYWNPGDHDRTRLFVRRHGEMVELLAGDTVLTRLGPGEDNLRNLRELQKQGRLRTRALTTTLFARLCLGDLFIHGIGGARYDEITDSIMSLFFETPAPQFVTLTATLQLPLEPYSSTRDSVGQLKEALRHLQFNGVEDDGQDRSRALQIRRAELLAAIKEDRAAEFTRTERRIRRPEARRRHLELVRIRHELAALAEAEVAVRKQELEAAIEEVRANSVLKSREFAACLFPEGKLHSLVEDVRREVCGLR